MRWALVLFLPLLCGSVFAGEAETTGVENVVADAAGAVITTNMFDIDYRLVLAIDGEKRGGGLAATEDELLVLTGEGLVWVANLETGESGASRIQLPGNNETAALAEAQSRFADHAPKRDRATGNIRKYLRYHDLLILDAGSERFLVVSYSYFHPEGACFSIRLSFLRLPGGTAFRQLVVSEQQWQLLYDSKPCLDFKVGRHAYAGLQAGGRMDALDAARGDIVLTVGDHEYDGYKIANYPQDPEVDYGKTLAINLFSRDKKLLSIGHRNHQGIVVDRDSKIWTVEHGPKGGDELNLVEEGRNFGWPGVTLGLHYGNKPWPSNPRQGRHGANDPPVYAWVPSLAVSNIDQSINFHPFWEGDLLVFTLKGMSIRRLRVSEQRVLFDEPIAFTERIRYGLNHAPSGVIFLWTDERRLYELRPAESAWALLETSTGGETGKDSDVDYVAIARCIECHTGAGDAPPELKGILGRPIAGTAYKGYSAVLRGKGGVWTLEALQQFLMNPRKFAPGTTMPDQDIASLEVFSDIARALADYSAQP